MKNKSLITYKPQKTKMVLALMILVFMSFGFFYIKTTFSPEKIFLNLGILYDIPLIPVEINKEKFDLILDLGAEDFSLNKEIIDKLHLLPTNRFKEKSNIYGTKNHAKYYLADTTTIGNSSVRHLEICESSKINSSPENPLPKEFTYGMIGRSFFCDKFLFLDYKNKKMHFGPAKSTIAVDPKQYKKGEWIHFDFYENEGSEIIIETIIDGILRKFVIDTGSNQCIWINRSKDSLIQEPTMLSVQSKDGLELGAFNFKPIQNPDFHLDGILGSELFNQYVVGIDFPNKKLFLLKY